MVTASITYWFNNHQAASVLMIDDLSDTYVDAYQEPYKNDWGYLTTQPNSSFSFLKKNFLNQFPKIKITFFVPYLAHGLCHPKGKYPFKAHPISQRKEFKAFLNFLVTHGHELAHHGSNHGYYQKNKPANTRYFVQEWTTLDSNLKVKHIIEEGMEYFKKASNYLISGGKYCGYQSHECCLETLEKSSLLYWCCNVTYFQSNEFFYKYLFKFPTTLAGNIFVKYKYLTKNLKIDFIKYLIGWFIQPISNYFSKKKLKIIYEKKGIISIQEHMSHTHTHKAIQSGNIISDISSLKKIYSILKPWNIWYATCKDITQYIILRNHCKLSISKNKLTLNLVFPKKIQSTITLCLSSPIICKQKNITIHSYIKKNNNLINLAIQNGKNDFFYETS